MARDTGVHIDLVTISKEVPVGWLVQLQLPCSPGKFLVYFQKSSLVSKPNR